MEFIRVRPEVQARQGPQLFTDQLVVVLGGVEPGAHGGAADSQAAQLLQGRPEHPAGGLHQLPPAGNLLGKAQGRGVLEVGPADADEVGIGRLQVREGPRQPLCRREDLIGDGQRRRDVEGGGVGVVGGLGGVDVVIGVELYAPVRRQVGDDLVDVHIGLGAASRLPDHQGELLVPLSRPDLLTGGGDGGGLFLRQLARGGVGPGASLF